MTRSFSLRVEVLEDRCVPDATQLAPIATIVPPPATTYVIDPQLINPNIVQPPPAPPVDNATTPPPTNPINPFAGPTGL